VEPDGGSREAQVEAKGALKPSPPITCLGLSAGADGLQRHDLFMLRSRGSSMPGIPSPLRSCAFEEEAGVAHSLVSRNTRRPVWES
jgi:hypothetical protein